MIDNGWLAHAPAADFLLFNSQHAYAISLSSKLGADIMLEADNKLEFDIMLYFFANACLKQVMEL